MTLFHAISFGRQHQDVGRTAAGTIMRIMYLDGTVYYLVRIDHAVDANLTL